MGTATAATATGRSGGLGRALTEVLQAATVDSSGRATLFGAGRGAPGIEERLDRALAVLAAAFPGDVVASRLRAADAGPVIRVRSEEAMPPELAFRLHALFGCSGDELLLAPLEQLGDEAALAVWRPHGAFSPAERDLVLAVAELAGR